MSSSDDIVHPVGPYVLHGPVVPGFQRGSKQLGIPTANLDPAAFKEQIVDIPAGVYFGWATVDGKGPYKAVLSVGWNPFFGNKEKTIEPHLVHKFDADFYGAQMRLCICGWIRPEKNFDSLEALVAAIHADIATGVSMLDSEPYTAAQQHVLQSPL